MFKVLNSKDEPIVLNAREQMIVNHNQEIVNSLGYEIPITTLTAISKRIVGQKFFEIPPADYFPVLAGNGAFSSSIETFRDFSVVGNFKEGYINTGRNNGRIAEADSAVDSVNVKITDWAKMISWSLTDLQKAAKAGNWSIITSKERARKKNYDLGIQEIAFLGDGDDAGINGLITQPDVTSNTAIITKYINTMTPAQFDAFVGTVYEAYRSNCNRTARPTHFAIPEADFNGLVNFPDATYPLKNKLTLLQEAFATVTQNPNFKILPLAYADKAVNNDLISLNKNRYSLYNADEDSIRMDLPVPYTATVANSINGYQFQNVAYAEFTGAKAYRPAEMLYFDF